MILVTGVTGNVDQHVVSELLRTGATLRALLHNTESTGLPRDVVRGDPSVPDRLDGVEAVFLVWPFFTAEAPPAFLNALTEHVRRIVYLSSEGVGDDLEQQTDTHTALITPRLAA
jgi:uncharacterized protein YbjT (DUF2867 family)